MVKYSITSKLDSIFGYIGKVTANQMIKKRTINKANEIKKKEREKEKK